MSCVVSDRLSAGHHNITTSEHIKMFSETRTREQQPSSFVQDLLLLDQGDPAEEQQLGAVEEEEADDGDIRSVVSEAIKNSPAIKIIVYSKFKASDAISHDGAHTKTDSNSNSKASGGNNEDSNDVKHETQGGNVEETKLPKLEGIKIDDGRAKGGEDNPPNVTIITSECGLEKWYWTCQRFPTWNENIF